jgi:hypothetical protein
MPHLSTGILSEKKNIAVGKFDKSAGRFGLPYGRSLWEGGAGTGYAWLMTHPFRLNEST